ncbi:MAG: glycosyltransferase family 39 protein, partial [Betaproteobacteria bacterium]
AHSFEWGYYKHPPLPTWLLIAASRLLGTPWWLTSILAGLCLMGTALASYALALRLTTRRSAQLAMLLWGLHLTLTWRADLYNHNTVLMLLCACMAWAVVAATQQRSLRHWLIAGACAGLALLAKYQAVVLMLVLLVALVRGGYLSDALHRKGLALAALLAALVFTPHLIWLFANDFLPLHYASTQLPTRWSLVGQEALISFILQQLRFFWPALAAVLVCIAFIPMSARSAKTRAGENPQQDDPRLAWVRLLALGPLTLVLLIGLAGTHLQNHWGMQTLQFASMGLALWLARRSTVRPRQMLVVAGALQLLLLGYVTQHMLHIREVGWQGQGDKFYPAGPLAQEALADWQRATSCSLHYVVGPSFEAGTIAVFSGQNPAVFERGSRIASPWIDTADVQRSGALYVAYSRSELPHRAATQGSMVITSAQNSKRPQTVYWSAVAPSEHCSLASERVALASTRPHKGLLAAQTL